MEIAALSVHPPLAAARRLALRIEGSVAAWEIAALVGLGAVAAVISARVELHLGIPGHAIVLAMLPTALGVALVPRRAAGSILSASALCSSLALRAAGLGERGAGAMVGLVAIGVLLDLALRRARSGASLYAAFAIAGLGANLLAFAARVGTRLFEGPGPRPLGAWIRLAMVTYPLSGALAGLLAAALWFRLRGDRGSVRA
jgi:hypothetical protein